MLVTLGQLKMGTVKAIFTRALFGKRHTRPTRPGVRPKHALGTTAKICEY